ncbi:helix-turn-helix domain-containing protein [Candidatus Peregrinibacteria bacterium]|nr:helix-turn-helix domain-containing protein [Candidatus Peregrinibacteria bacterium]
MKLKEKQFAILLRKQGKSYKEILSEIPHVSKSTISKWLSKLHLSQKEHTLLQKNIGERIHKGLLKALATKRNVKQRRIEKIRVQAQKTFAKCFTDPFFISGIILYWAEGAKTTERVLFMNSDPRLITLMLRWFQKFLKIAKERFRLRLYIHRIYANENLERFWQDIIQLPARQFLKTIYKPTPHTIKKNPLYCGCIRIDAGGVNEFHMIKFWEELLAGKFNLMHP